MFTGIVEEIGKVTGFSTGGRNAQITVQCKKILEDVKIGDSISINGVCQTVTEFSLNTFCAEISAETLSVTNFRMLNSGDNVNLERALTLSARLGGHLVSGHVDGCIKFISALKSGEFYTMNFEIPKELSKYVVKKGSVAINGISLTVADLFLGGFSVAVIPHTYENTVLSQVKAGQLLNFECDILAKYVEKFLSTGNNKTMDVDFLKENGFV